jgi:hypothetical protein
MGGQTIERFDPFDGFSLVVRAGSTVYPLFQQVRTELTGDNLPASTSVVVAGFVFPGMHLETKVVAVI